MKKKDGGPAFPVPNDANVNRQEGMSLHAYFAGQALQGMAASKYWSENFVHGNPPMTEAVAKAACSAADALIAELEKQ